MPVTAQDFIDISGTLLHYEFNDGDNAYLIGRFDALLSRARQEVRREALKEMDDTWLKVDACLPETFEPLYKLRQEYSNQP